MKKQEIKYFTQGISYQEHIKKAQNTYDTVVKHQVEEERKLKNDNKKLILTPVQKASANCPNPF
jgi:hypothetical protein